MRQFSFSATRDRLFKHVVNSTIDFD